MVVIYFIGISVLFGLINYHKVKKTKLKYFVFFLIYVFLFAEGLGAFVGLYLKKPSFSVYNTYTLINFTFYFYLFKYLFKNRRMKKLMQYFFYSFLLFSITIYLININAFIYDLNLVVIFTGSILLVITIILYLIEILNNNKLIFKIINFLPFWISIGNLLFFIGIVPIIIMRKYLNYSGLYDIILRSLNFVMYGCFTIGFILAEKKYLKNIK